MTRTERGKVVTITKHSVDEKSGKVRRNYARVKLPIRLSQAARMGRNSAGLKSRDGDRLALGRGVADPKMVGRFAGCCSFAAAAIANHANFVTSRAEQIRDIRVRLRSTCSTS